VFLIYGSKITAASRGFPATARLSCLLADRITTNGRGYATVLPLCIVDKRCVLEQKLILTAYRKSHMRINRLVPKWMTLTFV